MNHEPEVIRARFVEAAFTERYLANAMAPTGRGYWPVFLHDAEDRKGWDDAARLDNAAKWKGRASTGAVGRHQECLDWTAELIHDEKRRHIIWSWAFARQMAGTLAPGAPRKVGLDPQRIDVLIPHRTEPHLDLIQTEEDAENFAKFLRRRNEREAKRRAKLGLDAA